MAMKHLIIAKNSHIWLGIVVLSALSWVGEAAGQTITTNILGTVSDEGGRLPGASVTAKAVDSGFTYEANTDAQGTYALQGLRPGTYEITVVVDQYKPDTRTVQVLIGRTATLDFLLTANPTIAERVEVVGSTRLAETRTSEIATVVTQEEVRFLPQDQRNFLNFAALAPGVRVSNDELKKQVTAGGLDATQVNVFIDGVSFKNDILEGGVVGQDSSRGSPFPQSAVEEFAVLTQNYKAEHEKASSAVITAATRSGTNQWTGDLFLFYQDRHLIARDRFAKERDLPKPTYERWQPGASLGGPIVRDKLLVFGAYEENRQDRDSQVILGGTPVPPGFGLGRFEGTFPSQFRERLGFSKLTYQPSPGQSMDVSYSVRTEDDVRDFGAQTSFEAASDLDNRVDSILGRWGLPGNAYLNELTVTYQRSNWSQHPLNPDLVGIDYEGVIRVGGRDSTQEFTQSRFSVRNDYTRHAQWRGSHLVKTGAVFSVLDYDVSKQLFGNPLFRVRSSTGFAFPSEASYGVGDPDLSATNNQLGIFVQDDWTATSHLTINAGLRWDYESDMLNNEFVTPGAVRAATASFVDANRYFTDGDNRPPFYDAWQPRVGASFDLTGTGQHVLFGGFGRYYDRIFYNAGLDERYRLQYATRMFRFSSAGGVDPNGFDTIAWDPAYLSKAGLDSLIARGVAPAPEIFLLANDTKPPVSDQFTGGIRTSVRGILLTASYAGIRARNGLTYEFANRRPDGTCCLPIPGFSNILISRDVKKTWNDALFVTADRPFRDRWGFRLAYTLAQGETIGGDLFSFDYPTVEDYPRHPTRDDERHRIIATGIVQLPYDLMLSSVVTVSSGLGFTVLDESRGSAIGQKQVLLSAGRPDKALAYRSADVRVEKIFGVGGTRRASVAAEAFNVLNAANEACYEGFIPTLPAVNHNFGNASCVVDNSTRRFQFAVRYSF
jgi:carboxypeptidase family protein/TonB-dependent receptor-like protein